MCSFRKFRIISGKFPPCGISLMCPVESDEALISYGHGDHIFMQSKCGVLEFIVSTDPTFCTTVPTEAIYICNYFLCDMFMSWLNYILCNCV